VQVAQEQAENHSKEVMQESQHVHKNPHKIVILDSKYGQADWSELKFQMEGGKLIRVRRLPTSAGPFVGGQDASAYVYSR